MTVVLAGACAQLNKYCWEKAKNITSALHVTSSLAVVGQVTKHPIVNCLLSMNTMYAY